MGITTALFAVVARERWKWSMAAVLGFAIPFLVIDLAFFGANIIKISDGGWFPLLVGATIFTMMTTWFTRRRILSARLAEGGIATDAFVRELEAGRVHRVRGTAVFLTRQQEGIPTALLHNVKHNKVVHERVVLLSVMSEETPHLVPEGRYEWTDLGHGVHRILRFGFMEDPDLPEVLATIAGPVSFEGMTTSYFLGRETLIPSNDPGMAIWREHQSAWMTRNASGAAACFSLPPNQVIELERRSGCDGHSPCLTLRDHGQGERRPPNPSSERRPKRPPLHLPRRAGGRLGADAHRHELLHACHPSRIDGSARPWPAGRWRRSRERSASSSG